MDQQPVIGPAMEMFRCCLYILAIGTCDLWWFSRSPVLTSCKVQVQIRIYLTYASVYAPAAQDGVVRSQTRVVHSFKMYYVT